MADWSRLKRKKQAMPPDVQRALVGRRLMPAYRARPAYQQNDYLAWIQRAKLPATKAKRLEQMLSELKAGTKYMNMPYRGTLK